MEILRGGTESHLPFINGQIWQQVEYDYEYTYEFMPEVLIFMSRNSSWKMR